MASLIAKAPSALTLEVPLSPKQKPPLKSLTPRKNSPRGQSMTPPATRPWPAPKAGARGLRFGVARLPASAWRGAGEPNCSFTAAQSARLPVTPAAQLKSPSP